MAVARVIFLYSDDLIQPVIEHQIWNSLHYMDVHFYPPHSEWIHCHCTIYSPHYNECGPRTLLALTIMALECHLQWASSTPASLIAWSAPCMPVPIILHRQL